MLRVRVTRYGSQLFKGSPPGIFASGVKMPRGRCSFKRSFVTMVLETARKAGWRARIHFDREGYITTIEINEARDSATHETPEDLRKLI